MKPKYQNSNGIIASKINPFVTEMISTINQGYKVTGFATTQKDVISRTTGEITDEVAITGFKKIVDKDEFVKIFSNSIYEIFDCSKRAKDVFTMLLKCYMKGEYNADKVYFTFEVAQDDYLYPRTQSTFISAINELMKKRFIAKVERQHGWFWINPNMFFKGDRMILMQDIALKGSKAAKNQNAEVNNYSQLSLPFKEK